MLICTALTALCLHAGPADESLEQELGALFAAELEPAAPLEARIAALGADVVPPLFACLEARAVGDEWAPGGEGFTLDGSRYEAGLAAFGLVPRSAVQALADALAEEVWSSERRSLALRVGAVARLDCARVIALATPPEEDARLERGLRHRATEAFEAALADSARDAWLVHARWSTLHPQVAECAVEAIGALEPADSLPVLTRSLGVVAGLDCGLLRAVADAARRRTSVLSADYGDAVRKILETTDDSATRYAAAVAAGALGDPRSVPRLVELVGGDDVAARIGAAQALEDITGLELDDNHDRWLAWYEEELRWWTLGSPETFAALRSSHPSRVANAIHEIGRHRLDTDGLALELVVCLDHDEDAVVRLTCEVLALQGSWNAVPGLVRLARGGDRAASEAALQALARITGHAGPADDRRWDELLERSAGR